ncbi:MAG: DUF3696 domain-containing protein [Anaerolineales bacterium]|nr:DUF3696 domain-containing protein [Anaerolineales bacterium]
MIKWLRLRNFKCFEDQTIEFGPLTLLSGLNGQGKSSVLQALLLLRQSYQQGLLPKTGLALNSDLISVGTGKDALFENAGDDDKIGFEIQWSNNLEANWLFKSSSVGDVLDLASSPVKTNIFKASLFSDDFQYLQAERLGPRVSSIVSDFRVRQHRQLGTRGEYTVNFLSIFERDKIAHPNLAHPKAISFDLTDQIEAWIGEVSPGTRLSLTSYPGIDQISLRYSFGTGSMRSQDYRSTNVGFGLSYTLPILVAILSSQLGALILLENPEAHLHPKGQVQMGELIARAASSGIQIVVETHSDHVLNGIRLAVHSGILPPDDARLHFFERREEGDIARSEIISPRIDRNGRIDYWPDGFFDQWEKSLETLLSSEV